MFTAECDVLLATNKIVLLVMYKPEMNHTINKCSNANSARY